MLFFWGSQIGLVLQLKALDQGSCFRWPLFPLTWVVLFPLSIAHPLMSPADSEAQCLWKQAAVCPGIMF